MSLTPIGMAFAVVALLFIGVSAASARWARGGRAAGDGVSPTPPMPTWGAVTRAAWLPATVEALLLTLLAALWFGSLGHGGWVLVFLLLGALASGGDRWLEHRLAGAPTREELRHFATGLLKYLVAGGLCVWCLT